MFTVGRSKVLILTLAVTSLFIFSCRYSKVNGTNLSDSTNATFSGDEFISYDLVKVTAMKTCLNCHSGNQAPNLSILSEVQSHIATIHDETSTAGMPPTELGYSALDACNQAILDQWLASGAQEVTTVQIKSIAACSHLVEPVDVPIAQSPLTYDTLVTKFLQKKCLQCHNAGSSDPDARAILFYPYSEVVNNPRNWRSPSQNSKVVQEITSQDMPPSDSGVAPATPEEIDFVKRWIDAGRPQ